MSALRCETEGRRNNYSIDRTLLYPGAWRGFHMFESGNLLLIVNSANKANKSMKSRGSEISSGRLDDHVAKRHLE